MRRVGRSRATLAVLCLMASQASLVGCRSDTGESRLGADPSPSATTTPPPALTNGKDDEQVAPGSYLSPPGFEPELVLEVPSGWTSVHRYGDAFDLGQPDPDRDAPLLAVVLLRPAAASAQAALAAVRRKATGTVVRVHGRVAGVEARGLDVVGGRGKLIDSAGGGIALDAQAGQRARVLAADVGGDPLVVVVVVPDGRRWSELWPRARDLLAGITPA